MLYGIQCYTYNYVYLQRIIYLVNRLDDILRDPFWRFMWVDVCGESTGKAVRDIMRLSSGLRCLEYVLVCTVVFERRCFTIILCYIYYFSLFSYLYIRVLHHMSHSTVVTV